MPEALSARRTETAATAAARTGTRTFVLDTSVLLSDPKAPFRFAEHAVVRFLAEHAAARAEV